MTWFFKLGVIDGPLPLAIWGLTIVGVIVLLVRRPTPAWLWRIVIALAVGIGGGVALVIWANATDAFGGQLPFACSFWVPAGFAAALVGIVSLWERRAWRKIVAVLVVILALLSTTLGVNAAFGINKTVGSMFGISTEDQIDGLPKPAPTQTSSGPLYQSWTPPAGMPATGQTALLSGAHAIPSTGGFTPRPATIYLPPAALTKNPPRLPLVVLMMGYPGNPEPTFITPVLDKMAKENKGLAPIVIIADQLGTSGADPMCVDSRAYGSVSTYFNTDIPAYAEKQLNVILDHSAWTIMGYSNGGACAFTWATHRPDIWTSVIAISPDQYPGVEESRDNIAKVFDGDFAKFDQNKPAAGIEAHPGAFTDRLAVFTVGENDHGFIPGVQKNVELAKKAGYDARYYTVPGAGHVQDALTGGIPYAMQLLYKRLGLSP
ncbi:alpha/beta hydrolase [Microbacterium sp. NPDC089698]|uniref:alpha/beta hydrolase n=1 Tax=unclassified Microbacterium TaxID=2609290 RepID=UPI002821035A|nr:alpha/beta hydrolase-fold protein [Microbacterium sp.]MDR2321194.1 alpha/beta hydrolase [Microbacterium sp.]